MTERINIDTFKRLCDELLREALNERQLSGRYVLTEHYPAESLGVINVGIFSVWLSHGDEGDETPIQEIKILPNVELTWGRQEIKRQIDTALNEVT